MMMNEYYQYQEDIEKKYGDKSIIFMITRYLE
jgi:hypothetical protein